MKINELNQKISEIVHRMDGKIGIYALHSRSSFTFGLNENESFPMASLDKIPIAMKIMNRVKKQELNLDRNIDILHSDLRPGGILDKRFSLPGVSLSLANLIRILLEVSDNTASDILLRLAGGPGTVTEFLKKIGLNRTRIDKSCLQSFAEDAGIKNIPFEEICTPELYKKIQAVGSLDESKKDFNSLPKDDRDTTTPSEFSQCLLMIYYTDLLDSKLSNFIIDCMERCQTGRSRIKALLPYKTKVAHKTGTFSRATNDAGLIELPSKNACLSLTVLIKESNAPLSEKEKAISEIALLLFNYVIKNEI